MHLAYSAINTNDDNRQQSIAEQRQPDNDLMLRYQAYQTVCNKYSREIAAIQKYIPGWVPKFR
jgi:hypothetical protein